MLRTRTRTRTRVRVGTSGFGYHGWSPGFYPPSLPHADYARHYASELDFVELNDTFFEFPSPSWAEDLFSWLPESFLVSAKLHRRLTHQRPDDLGLARQFARRVRPLAEADRLAAVVAQFPFSFVNNPDNRAYLCRVRAALELPLVAELRNPGWHRPETSSFLRGWGVGLVCIDTPSLAGLAPPSAEASTSIGYVRFHGRRPELWWARDGRRPHGRYDYRYRRRELLGWLPRIRQLARDADDVFVVFNNHGSPHALTNVRAFKKLLERSESRRSSSRARARAPDAARAG